MLIKTVTDRKRIDIDQLLARYGFLKTKAQTPLYTSICFTLRGVSMQRNARNATDVTQMT